MELVIAKELQNTFYGQVPLDWIACEFEDVLNGFSSGMTPYRGVPEYYKGNIPWITSGELNYNVITDTIEKITNEAVIKTNLKILPIGTFLMAITGLEAAGTRGSCAITGVEATTNQSCMALFPKEGKADTDYLYHFYIQYGDVLAFHFCQGSKQQSYTGRIAKILPINLPPTLEEQKAIATSLTDVDTLITNLDDLIAKKKAIKQGAMQQLLTPPSKGGKRLDGFDGEWERKEVQKYINVGRGGSPRPIQDYITNSPDGVNWIKIGDTSKLSKYITSSKEKIIREGEVLSRAVKVGDFLLSNSMSFGRPYILKINGCIHDGWLVLQDYQDYFNIDFLYYTLMSKDVFDQYLQKASGSGVLNLNKELVKVVELNRPTDLKEQQAIAQILSDMDKELEELTIKKEKYQHIKQGMMQELLTGKTRLV